MVPETTALSTELQVQIRVLKLSMYNHFDLKSIAQYCLDVKFFLLREKLCLLAKLDRAYRRGMLCYLSRFQRKYAAMWQKSKIPFRMIFIPKGYFFTTPFSYLLISGNAVKIRCSIQVIRGRLVDVINIFICTPSGYNKSSKIKGFQGSTPYHFSLLPHFYPTTSPTKFNNFFII